MDDYLEFDDELSGALSDCAEVIMQQHPRQHVECVLMLMRRLGGPVENLAQMTARLQDAWEERDELRARVAAAEAQRDKAVAVLRGLLSAINGGCDALTWHGCTDRPQQCIDGGCPLEEAAEIVAKSDAGEGE